MDFLSQYSDDRPSERAMSGDRLSLPTLSDDAASPCFDMGAAEEYLDAPFGLSKGDIFEVGVGGQGRGTCSDGCTSEGPRRIVLTMASLTSVQ